MRTLNTLLSAAAFLALAGAPALADCVNTSAGVSSTDKTAAISKDGSKAPLETNTQRSDGSMPAAKDGKTMPLATEEGGGNKNLATSQQDVEAQQQGDKVAAAVADANKDDCK